MNKMVKKWYDICLEAEVAEDEVLEVLTLSWDVMISLCHADMRLPG